MSAGAAIWVFMPAVWRQEGLPAAALICRGQGRRYMTCGLICQDAIPKQHAIIQQLVRDAQQAGQAFGSAAVQQGVAVLPCCCLKAATDLHLSSAHHRSKAAAFQVGELTCMPPVGDVVMSSTQGTSGWKRRSPQRRPVSLLRCSR